MPGYQDKKAKGENSYGRQRVWENALKCLEIASQNQCLQYKSPRQRKKSRPRLLKNDGIGAPGKSEIWKGPSYG